MKTTTKDQKPLTVPFVDRPKGHKQLQWSWAKPVVWTERMLATLERGMKERRWYSLIDKVYEMKTLQLAWKQVKTNAGACGVDGITVASFAKDDIQRLLVVKEQIQQNRYQPQPVKRVWIPKLGTNEKRPLGIPVVKDRIVQAALRMVLEPIFEQTFAEHSYGFRPGRGCKDALRQTQRLLHSGKSWVVDADLKGYFDTIPHKRLMEKVAERVADRRILEMIQMFLKQGIMDGGLLTEAGEEGTPQGAVMSPLLANIYLNALDHKMAKAGYDMVRYADDFVILCSTEEQAKEALEQVRMWVEENGLKLHPQKTRIIDMKQSGGFDFLGYHFEKKYRWPRKKSLEKFQAKIREITPRLSGKSLPSIIKALNPCLKGWFEYFKHSHATTFGTVDGRVRSRLRSILRKRLKRKGLATVKDQERWPNRYFEQLGLFSLQQAYNAIRRSPQRSKY